MAHELCSTLEEKAISPAEDRSGAGRGGAPPWDRGDPPPRQRSPPRKRSSQEAGFDEGEDIDADVTSPMKPSAPISTESTEEPAARRNLNVALTASSNISGERNKTGKEPVINDQNRAVVVLEKGAAGVPLENLSAATPPPPPAYVSPRELKKAKKGASPAKDRKMALLADSVQEYRQAQ